MAKLAQIPNLPYRMGNLFARTHEAASMQGQPEPQGDIVAYHGSWMRFLGPPSASANSGWDYLKGVFVTNDPAAALHYAGGPARLQTYGRIYRTRLDSDRIFVTDWSEHPTIGLIPDPDSMEPVVSAVFRADDKGNRKLDEWLGRMGSQGYHFMEMTPLPPDYDAGESFLGTRRWKYELEFKGLEEPRLGTSADWLTKKISEETERLGGPDAFRQRYDAVRPAPYKNFGGVGWDSADQWQAIAFDPVFEGPLFPHPSFPDANFYDEAGPTVSTLTTLPEVKDYYGRRRGWDESADWALDVIRRAEAGEGIDERGEIDDDGLFRAYRDLDSHYMGLKTAKRKSEYDARLADLQSAINALSPYPIRETT